MPGLLTAILLTLPFGAVIGWFGNKLFGPIADELGVLLKGWFMGKVNKDEYSTYIVYSSLHKKIAELHSLKGHNYFREQKPYLDSHDINLEIKSKNTAQLRAIADTWIKQTRIRSFNESDIYFAGLEILLSWLTKENLNDIYENIHGNNQATIWPFLEYVEEKRPTILSNTLIGYLRDEQKEQAEILRKREAKNALKNSL